MADDPTGTSVTQDTSGGIPSAGPAPGTAGWRSWAVGTRVVVRRRLAEGGWTDVLGELIEVSSDGVRVATRRGPVHVPAADIALGKPVPPPPARRESRAGRTATGEPGQDGAG